METDIKAAIKRRQDHKRSANRNAGIGSGSGKTTGYARYGRAMKVVQKVAERLVLNKKWLGEEQALTIVKNAWWENRGPEHKNSFAGLCEILHV